jgi:carbon-monoxide dehydrogenase small subunit
MTKIMISLTVNGERHEIAVEPGDTLNFVIREILGLTGTKKGCDSGGCGACTVLMDQKPIYSCMMYAVKADGSQITTIEGLQHDGQLDPIQKAFANYYALQCGYCTPGFIMVTKALLDRNPHPTEEEVKKAFVGNLCRCTGYTKIVEAVLSLSERCR